MLDMLASWRRGGDWALGGDCRPASPGSSRARGSVAGAAPQKQCPPPQRALAPEARQILEYEICAIAKQDPVIASCNIHVD